MNELNWTFLAMWSRVKSLIKAEAQNIITATGLFSISRSISTREKPRAER